MRQVIHKVKHQLNTILHRGHEEYSSDPYSNNLKDTCGKSTHSSKQTLGISGTSTRCSSTLQSGENSMLKFGGLLPSKHNFHALHINNYIKNQRNLRIIGVSASFILFIISALTIYPIVKNSTSAEAISPVAADTVLTFTSSLSSANLDLLVKDSSGTFASSSNGEMAKFNIVTNNYTGYTLSILSSEDNNGQLSSDDETNKTVFKSIEHYTDADTFKNGSSTLYNNKWGYLPSRYNSEDNTFFRPAPTETATTLDETSSANQESNNYTIALGARADYSTPNGVYSNTFILTLVANNIPYTLNFSDTTGDSSVSGLPSTETSTTTETKVKLPTNIPTRTGYTFAGWCDVEPTVLDNGSTSCIDASTGEAGTVYSASTEDTPSYFNFINQTVESNIATLYTMWTINSYTCTKQYRLQNADGTFPTSYTVDETETELVEYKSTCTYSKSITDYKSTADGTNDSEAFTSGVIDSTEGITLSLDFYRNTFALTVNRNTTYISSASATTAAVHGTNYYRWGQSVSISATASSGNEFTSWSQTAGATGSFGSTTSASTTFIMPKDDATIYADGKIGCMTSITGTMQAFNLCSGATLADGTTGSLTDSRDNQVYTVVKYGSLFWMTRNLAIGCNGHGSTYGSNITVRTLTSTNSNVLSNWDTPTADLSKGSFYEAQMVCSATYGAWYNYVATSAGTITTNSNANEARYSICPSGWRLFTSTERDTSAAFQNVFRPVTGGYNLGAIGNTDRGYWWTSTSTGTTQGGYFRYFLEYDDGYGLRNDNYNREYGLYVRCVKSA